jgi:hypothetical protein
MSKYRFKTEQEFIRDGQWYVDYDCPIGWAECGQMNHYLGQDVPEGADESCDVGEGFNDDGWYFESTNYVLKEEDYTGRYIKALVDNPSLTSVELGEVIKIIGKPSGYRLDKTSKGYSGMGIQCPLDTSKWELIEESKHDTKLSSFPSSGAILIDECDNLKEFKRYLFDSSRTCNEAVGNPKYLSWNGTSFWYPTTGTGKTMYKWNQLKHFIPASKVVPGYVKCVQALTNAKVGTVYPVVDESHCLCEDGGTYNWDSIEFTPATKQEYDAQFLDKQDPLYICKQKYRKGMKVRSAATASGVYSGEFIIDVEPSEFRNLAGKKNVVDYSFSNGYLYFNGEYAEILEESPAVKHTTITTFADWHVTTAIDDYLANSGFKESNPEAYNWLMKPSIEPVQSVDVKLRTKKQINKFKF